MAQGHVNGVASIIGVLSRCSLLGFGLVMLPAVLSPALGQSEAAASLGQPNVSARKIFIMMFLMLGRSRS
jgi:hypothetical protein